MSDDNKQLPVQISIDVPTHREVGKFADFVNVWHTPQNFVLDFLSIKNPPQPVPDPETGEMRHAVLSAVVGSRVRIPAEQIFPLINALQQQGEQWLSETGRAAPPEAWLPHQAD
ncbi:MAG TPA: DUF3467 domain-containing protein [Microbacteriaceae bacterium]